MKQKIILGSPGCGKTTRLLNIMEQEMADGILPSRIAFVSFTRKASGEAAERAMEKFGFSKQDMPYFRTLHSLAYQELGLSTQGVMRKEDYNHISKMLSVEFTGYYSVEEGLPAGGKVGDRMLFIDSLARARMMPLEKSWAMAEDSEITWGAQKQFSETLRTYKDDSGLADFTDMLELYPKECEPLNIDVAIVDEAQDLSTLQWAFAEHALKNAKRRYIAGDDDQAIYAWSGADVDIFLNLKGEVEVLEKSHRLPQTIYDYANKIAGRISERYAKKWSPRDDIGSVSYVTSLDQIEFKDAGTWLLLARNAYMLKELAEIAKLRGLTYTLRGRPSVKLEHVDAIRYWEHLRGGNTLNLDEIRVVYNVLKSGHGVKRGFKQLKNIDPSELYTINDLLKDHGLMRDDIWHDALLGIPVTDRTYYLSVLKKGGSLTQPPRIHINTIHGVKGGEADNVLLLTDMAYRSYKGYEDNPDDEHRVFYVGATRARHNLHIAMPRGRFCYPI